MAENSLNAQLVEKVVSQVLERHVSALRSELVQQVLNEVQAATGGNSSATGGGAADLLSAVSTIHAGTTQKEVLRALLDSTLNYSGRAALFVVKGGAATGWQGRGFDDNDSIKDFSLDMFSAAPSNAMDSRSAVAGPTADMDAKFIKQFGAPGQGQILLMPLHLKDKVAALVYADAGEAGKLDAPALELLVAATSAWLEVASLRKQVAKDGAGDSSGDRFESSTVPVQTVSSYSDPFAGHAPKHAGVAAEVPIAVASSDSGAAAAPARAVDPAAQMSPEDADTHRKAQRFIRLLMDEIKLYNQAKVAEGRKNKNLYDILRDDIEKSRATYNKRYGQTVAANADYFNQELIRSLAEDDISLLGPNFHR
jgi:hypothetical protein